MALSAKKVPDPCSRPMGSGKLRTTKIKTFFTNKLNYTLYVERVASYVLINKVELTCAVEVKNTFYDTDS